MTTTLREMVDATWPRRRDPVVATTSGTTGRPGAFVMDERAVAVNLALSGRMMLRWLGPAGIARLARERGRVAVVAATGGHYLVNAGTARMHVPGMRTFSAHAPLRELVAELDAFRPGVLIGYGSVLSQLAGEVWRAAHRELTALLAARGLAHVTVDRDETAPQQSAGGKYRPVIPLRDVPVGGPA